MIMTPRCVLQFYACEAMLEEQGIFGGERLSSLCVSLLKVRSVIKLHNESTCNSDSMGNE